MAWRVREVCECEVSRSVVPWVDGSWEEARFDAREVCVFDVSRAMPLMGWMGGSRARTTREGREVDRWGRGWEEGGAGVWEEGDDRGARRDGEEQGRRVKE